MVSRSSLKLIFLFAISYIAMCIISMAVPELRRIRISADLSMLDYTAVLLPVFGFFAIYLLIDWIDEYYKTKFARSIFFPPVFIILGLAAYYVALYWYYGNLSQLAGITEVTFDYFGTLLNSHFLLFLIAGLFGWLSKIAIERTENTAQKK